MKIKEKFPSVVNLTGSSSYKTFAYWTQEEENIIKSNASNLSIDELHLLVPRHSKKSLRTKAIRLGIKISKELKTKIAKYGRSKVALNDLCFTDLSLTLGSLNNKEYQMIVGSILGDGCCRINKGGRECQQQRNTYAQYFEGHGAEQTEYLKWKMPFFEKFKPRFFVKKNGAPEIITCTNPVFSQIRDLVYHPIKRIIQNKEVIRMEKTFPHPNLICKLDEFGLLIWYLDDGYAGPTRSFNKNRGEAGKMYPHRTIWPTIAVKSMDIPMLNQAVDTINKNLGLTLSVYESKWKDSTNRVIKFGAKNRDIILPKWIELANKHDLPQSMWYKLGFRQSNY